MKKIVGLILFGVACVIVIAYFVSTRSPDTVLQGQLEAHTVQVGAKVPGRVEKIYVHLGDQVKVGQPLVLLSSQEIKAKLAEAKAGYQAAQAIANKAKAGARPQQIAMAKAQYDRAVAGANFAQKSWDRVSSLAKEGLISQQKRDETYAQYRNAMELRDAAKAQYDMAKEGAQKEDILAAQEKANSVAALVDQAQLALNDADLKSPVAGQVSQIIPEVGELVAQGVPMIELVDLNQQTLYLNVREDQIKNFAVGHQFTGTIPALDNKKVTFVVKYSSVLPDFATWRPTRASQGYDMHTFQVQAKPTAIIQGMRPGMSVLVDLSEQE